MGPRDTRGSVAPKEEVSDAAECGPIGVGKCGRLDGSARRGIVARKRLGSPDPDRPVTMVVTFTVGGQAAVHGFPAYGGRASGRRRISQIFVDGRPLNGKHPQVFGASTRLNRSMV
jgi:hypothetical protein